MTWFSECKLWLTDIVLPVLFFFMKYVFIYLYIYNVITYYTNIDSFFFVISEYWTNDFKQRNKVNKQ